MKCNSAVASLVVGYGSQRSGLTRPPGRRNTETRNLNWPQPRPAAWSTRCGGCWQTTPDHARSGSDSAFQAPQGAAGTWPKSESPPHPGIRNRPEGADQIGIGFYTISIEHRGEAIQSISSHFCSPANKPVTVFEPTLVAIANCPDRGCMFCDQRELCSSYSS